MPEYRAEGTDISPYSHHGREDVAKVKFAITAVSDGRYLQDPLVLDEMIIDSELTGLYHYLRSDWSTQQNVDTFLSAIDPWDYDFLAVDFEKINNVHGEGAFGLQCRDFLRLIKAEVDVRVLLYTGKSVIQEWVLPFGQHWYQNEELWIAQYPYYGWNDVMAQVPFDRFGWNPRLPAGSTSWKIWQYSADGNGKAPEYGGIGNPDIDLNVYNGTIEEMKEWMAIAPPIVEPEPPIDPDPPVDPPIDPPVEDTAIYNEAIIDASDAVLALKK